MRISRVWARILKTEKVVVESVRYDPESDAIVVSVRARAGRVSRCGVCRRRAPGYDRGRRRRRWRALDAGTCRTYLEAEAPRVRCPRHGVVVAHLPWARHHAGHTRGFDTHTAWLATRMSKTAVSHLPRVGWDTVGQIIARVMADEDRRNGDGLDGLTRIGVDEVSYRRGHKYLTVVVDHDRRRVVWVAPGRSRQTLMAFFAALGPLRRGDIELVSADAAEWIASAVRQACPRAKLCLDPFHVVSWATDALDQIRRQVWNTARRGDDPANAGLVKNARWALWKNPGDLTDRQRATLASIQRSNRPLYRAYLLKEQLREVFSAPADAAPLLLDAWLRWAARSKLPDFADLARRIRQSHRAGILNTLEHRLSNGLIESTNTKIRLLTRMAFGFKSVDALIALVRLHLGGYRIELPGRA